MTANAIANAIKCDCIEMSTSIQLSYQIHKKAMICLHHGMKEASRVIYFL